MNQHRVPNQLHASMYCVSSLDKITLEALTKLGNAFYDTQASREKKEALRRFMALLKVIPKELRARYYHKGDNNV